jgi:hypothetical protein
VLLHVEGGEKHDYDTKQKIDKKFRGKAMICDLDFRCSDIEWLTRDNLKQLADREEREVEARVPGGAAGPDGSVRQHAEPGIPRRLEDRRRRFRS